jgi:hypothetical protein
MRVIQPINVTEWGAGEHFEPYPEGARDKTLVYSPLLPSQNFIKPNYPYLFKLSRARCPEQFWVEIFAYELGNYMNISVPPTFVAYNEEKNQTAALIEWFYSSSELYRRGGDYLTRIIPNFDRETGKQHNFQTIIYLFQQGLFADYINWKVSWTQILLFDALIGNTDRHQDNWGIIIKRGHRDKSSLGVIEEIRLSPAFDNGTSMGYELPAEKFKIFNEEKSLESYVNRGTHQLRWKLDDIKKSGHSEMLLMLVDSYPETRQIMLQCLENVNYQIFENILHELTKLDVPIKLTPERAAFMLKLINFRHQRLLKELDK